MFAVRIMISLLCSFFASPLLGMTEGYLKAKKGNQEVVILNASGHEGIKDECDYVFSRLKELSSEKEQLCCLVSFQGSQALNNFTKASTVLAAETNAINIEYLQFARQNLAGINNLVFHLKDVVSDADLECNALPLIYLNQQSNILMAIFQLSGELYSTTGLQMKLKNKSFAQSFFSDNGIFKQLSAALRNILLPKNATPLSMKKYTELLKKEGLAFFDKAQKTGDDSLQKYARQLCNKLEKQIENLMSFIGRFSDENKPPLEIYFDLIEERKSFMDASSLINKEIMPCFHTISSMRTCSALLELLQKHTRIFHITRTIMAPQLRDLLIALGFGITELGNLNPIIGEHIKHDGHKMPLHTLKRALNSSFCTEAQAAPSESPDAKTTSSRDTYFNKQTGEFQEKTVDEQNECTCSSCREKFHAVTAFLREKDNAYCSFSCFLRGLTQHKKAIGLLSEQRTWTQEEQDILLKFAGLCELQKLLFCDTLSDDKSKAFSINHSERIDFVTRLMAHLEGASLNDPFKKALSLGQDLDISLRAIRAFHQLFKIQKDLYLKNLLAGARNHSYSFLSFASTEVFDPQSKMRTYQETLVRTLHNSLHCQETTPAHTFYRMYHEIAQYILTRLNKKTKDAYVSIQIHAPQETRTLDALLKAFEDTLSIAEDTEEGELEVLDAPPHQKETATEQNESTVAEIPQAQTANAAHPAQTHYQLIEKKQKKVNPCIFCKGTIGGMSYLITLFRANRHINNPDLQAEALWKRCTSFKEAMRIKTLFALESTATAQKLTEDANVLLLCPQNSADTTLLEKVDLHHLFCRAVDHSCFSLGIAETIDNLVQISIPGSITLANGETTIGFFQYSFIPRDWILVHRCFKNFKQQHYISDRLRTALWQFVIMQPDAHFADHKIALEKFMQPLT